MPRLKDFDYSNKAVYITTKTWKNQKVFISDESVNFIYAGLDQIYDKYDFKINGFVVMPDHLHLIIVSRNNDLSDIMHDLKGRIAFNMLKNRIIKTKLWQKTFYDHVTRNNRDLLEKLNYIHKNPSRAGLVKEPALYKYSSFKFYYEDGHKLPRWFQKVKIYSYDA
jgi:putative transposase